MSPVQASAGTAYLQGSGEAVPGLLHLLVLVTVPVLWLWPCCFSLSHGCQTACPLPTETPITGSETPSSVTSEYIPPSNRGGLTFYGSQILKGTTFSPAQHHGSISSRAPPCCSAGGHRATGETQKVSVHRNNALLVLLLPQLCRTPKSAYTTLTIFQEIH